MRTEDSWRLNLETGLCNAPPLLIPVGRDTEMHLYEVLVCLVCALMHACACMCMCVCVCVCVCVCLCVDVR